MKPVRAAARSLLSGLFVVSGVRAVTNPDALAPRAKPVTDRIAPLVERVDSRLPTDTRSMVRLNGAVQITGGLLLATGHFPRPAAAALAGSLVPTTVAGHAFWMHDDPVQRANHRIHFLKNLAVLGGLLLAAVDTEGRPGLRWRSARAFGQSRRSMQRTARAVRRDVRLAAKSARTAGRLPVRIG